MKIVVAVKRVVDPYARVRVKADKTAVETQNVKMSMNPFDEIALEEALRLRDENKASEVILVSIGEEACQETLRHGLAMGADKAILITTDKTMCSLSVAQILCHLVQEEAAQLVLMGKQSIDGDNNQTPQMLAALLDWPQATFASKLTLTENHLEVTREIDGGLETLSLCLPAVVSADLRLNTPRYATLPNIMKAKQKPLDIRPLDSLALHLSPHIQVLEVSEPASRAAGVKVASVEALLDKLQQEAKVL